VCDILSKLYLSLYFRQTWVSVSEQHITIWRDQLQGVTFHLFVVRELHAVGRNRTRSIIFSSLASSKMDIKRGVINVGRGECLTFTTEAVIKSLLGKINASTHATPVDCRKLYGTRIELADRSLHVLWLRQCGFLFEIVCCTNIADHTMYSVSQKSSPPKTFFLLFSFRLSIIFCEMLPPCCEFISIHIYQFWLIYLNI